MRKIFKVFIGGIILFGSSCISAQVNDVGTQKKNIVAFPTSANAYAMDKVGKLPIDMFRGKANINIPFYSISVDGLTIPISLSYNTGGIKLNEVASTVGLGWSLSIPNSISQSIMDKDDKSFSLYTKDINIVNSKVRSVGVYDNDIRQIVDDHYEGIYDTRPDIFNYSLPIGSGSFLINNDTGYTIPHEDLLITATNNKKNIKIINTDGASFYLSLKNRTTVDSGIPNDNISSTETLYQIDSIKTTTNKKVIFEYGKVYSYEEKNITEKSNIKISDDIVQGIDSVLPPLPEHERYVGSVSNSEKIITKIIFPGGVIYFNYSNDGLPFSDGSVIRKDLSGNNGIALRQILVKDTNGKIIKDYRLNFSYFNSTNGNNTYSDYRLKLLNVYDNLQNSYHKFFYNETYSFPPRNSNNDDYWGYINSLTYGEGNSNIPDEIYTDYTLKHIAIPGIYSRNRDTNSEYSQIGILNRIEYPTKGSKYLYYETANKFFNKTNYQWGYIDNFATVLNAPAGGISDGFGDVNQSVTIPASFFQGKESPQVKLIFGNTCENNVDDETSQIHETSCYGNAMIGSSHYGTNGKPAVFELNYQSGQPINISLSRTGKCQCGYGIDVIYGKYNTVNTNVPIGGLRIKKVEDKNENNIVNTYNYKYEILDKTTNTYKSSGILNMPFQYTRLLKRYITEDTQGNKLPAPYIQKYLIISNSSANYNAYGSSDVITYKQVTEYNDLGENTSVFSQSNISDSDRLYTHVYSNYDEWKNGLLEKNIILNKANDTVKVETNEYVFNNLKNSKSGFTTLDLNQIGYAFNLDISKYNKLISSSTGVGDVNAVLYDVEKEFISINSGKVERVKSKTTEYLPGNKIIETVTKSSYYDTDINKPMNVKTISTQSPDQSVSETTYQYAHEKNNQKLINANIISTPLETTVVEKQNATASGKTIARSETKYDDPANLFPTSVLSYDLLNNTPSTEVTYNKYDSKGNLQQFTTKDGIPTAIVWGYNSTQPIAKVQGTTYDQLVSLGLITAIVNASDSDAANPANEPALITALDNFRKNSGLSSYQVSTYTYDPLIGVTSITPPSGIREVYIYDTANRLKEVRQDSKTGNLLKEFKYNYKN